MAEIIFVEFYTLEQPLTKLSLTFLNVYMILCILGLFHVQNDKMEEIRTYSEK